MTLHGRLSRVCAKGIRGLVAGRAAASVAARVPPALLSLTTVLVLSATLVPTAAPEPAARAGGPGPERWITFAGSWSASGDRQVLAAGGDRRPGVFHLTGSLVLTSGETLRRGFLSEAIGYSDGRSTLVGSCVWTDDRGDQIFSDISGEPVGTARHIAGKIVGGTGAYAGATGEYTFEWQYVVQGEEGALAGRAVNLEGRIRRDQP
jgi:hypothetical protein